MVDINEIMRRQLVQAQQQMAARVRETDAKKAAEAAAAQKRQQELAVQEANRLAAEAAKAMQEAEQKKLELEKLQRVNLLIENAIKEVKNLLPGIANIEAIFLEKEDVLSRFLQTNPLEDALIAHKLDAVKFMLYKGQRYEAWRDIIDEGTEIYDFLNGLNTNNKSKIKNN